MTTQLLATPTDFANFGFANYGFAPAAVNAELSAASADAFDSIAERYAPPFSQWGDNLRRAVCTVAAWNLLCQRGFDATSPADVAVKTRFDFYTNPKDGWFLRVNQGAITLNDVIDSSPGQVDDEAIGGDGSDTSRFGAPDAMGNTIDLTVTP